MKTGILIAITCSMIACRDLDKPAKEEKNVLNNGQSPYPGTNYIAGLSPGFQIKMQSNEHNDSLKAQCLFKKSADDRPDTIICSGNLEVCYSLKTQTKQLHSPFSEALCR